MPLYNRLKEHRARLGVNQQEMGRMAGVSRQTISLIERRDYSPSVTLALTLAKICGVTVEDIFSLEEENDGAMRLWPQRHGTDGFYICRMRRQERKL